MIVNGCLLLAEHLTDYYMTYLGELLLAIHEDGIPVAGAFSWGKSYVVVIRVILDASLPFKAMMDNSEWFEGLGTRFEQMFHSFIDGFNIIQIRYSICQLYISYIGENVQAFGFGSLYVIALLHDFFLTQSIYYVAEFYAAHLTN